MDKSGLFCSSIGASCRSEMPVWNLLDSAGSNDSNREVRRSATNDVSQAREFSAIAKAARAKGGFVRKADIGVECSESPLSAISNSGGVAVSYCSGYALEVMREHLEKTWT